MKLQLKRSNVLELGAAKEPTAAQMEYGELAVNYNNGDPAIFLKDSNDNIIRIAGVGNINSGDTPSGEILPPTGNNVGDVFFNTTNNTMYYWDGTQWVPIANDVTAADIFVGTLAEIDAEVPKADRRNGFLWWNTEDGTLYIWYIDANTSQWVIAIPSSGGGGGGGASVAVNNVPPTSPDQGDMWWNTNDGRLYIWYQDVDTGQWVDASPDNQGATYWDRTGTTLSPINAGDDIKVDGDGTFNGNVRAFNQSGNVSRIEGNVTGGNALELKCANATDLLLDGRDPAGLNVFSVKGNGEGNFSDNVNIDGTTTILGNCRVGGAAGSPNITLNANGDIITNYPDGQPFATIKPTTNTANFNSYNNRGHQSNTRVLTCSYNGSAGIALAGGGNAYKIGGGSWSDISDARMKSNLADYTAGLAEIKQLQPKTYDFHGREHQHIGFVAQDIEGVMPETVSQETGTLPSGVEVNDLRSVNITAVHYATVNAIKEMATRIEALEAEVQALKGVN